MFYGASESSLCCKEFEIGPLAFAIICLLRKTWKVRDSLDGKLAVRGKLADRGANLNVNRPHLLLVLLGVRLRQLLLFCLMRVLISHSRLYTCSDYLGDFQIEYDRILLLAGCLITRQKMMSDRRKPKSCTDHVLRTTKDMVVQENMDSTKDMVVHV